MSHGAGRDGGEGAALPPIASEQHEAAGADRECGDGEHDDCDEQHGFAVHEGVQGTETDPASARPRHGKRAGTYGAGPRWWGEGGAAYFTLLFRRAPAVTLTVALAGMLIVSPVRGLRPVRAARFTFWNEMKPGI